MRDIDINSNLDPLSKFTSSSRSTKLKAIIPCNISKMIMKTVPISTRIVIAYAVKWAIPFEFDWKPIETETRIWSEFPNEGKRPCRTNTSVRKKKFKIAGLLMFQSFPEISPVQKEVLPSHKLQYHAYEWKNPSGLKEGNTSKKLQEPIKSSKVVPHRARMSAEFDWRKDSHPTKFEWRLQILVKLSFWRVIWFKVVWFMYFW